MRDRSPLGYVTQMGRVDIVPRLCGTYEELHADARPVRVAGHQVVSADPRTALERLHGHRSKDVAREPEIDAVRSKVDMGLALRPDLDGRF
jgi:hypothetical protein